MAGRAAAAGLGDGARALRRGVHCGRALRQRRESPRPAGPAGAAGRGRGAPTLPDRPRTSVRGGVLRRLAHRAADRARLPGRVSRGDSRCRQRSDRNAAGTPATAGSARPVPVADSRRLYHRRARLRPSRRRRPERPLAARVVRGERRPGGAAARAARDRPSRSAVAGARAPYGTAARRAREARALSRGARRRAGRAPARGRGAPRQRRRARGCEAPQTDRRALRRTRGAPQRRIGRPVFRARLIPARRARASRPSEAELLRAPGSRALRDTVRTPFRNPLRTSPRNGRTRRRR